MGILNTRATKASESIKCLFLLGVMCFGGKKSHDNKSPLKQRKMQIFVQLCNSKRMLLTVTSPSFPLYPLMCQCFKDILFFFYFFFAVKKTTKSLLTTLLYSQFIIVSVYSVQLPLFLQYLNFMRTIDINTKNQYKLLIAFCGLGLLPLRKVTPTKSASIISKKF